MEHKEAIEKVKKNYPHVGFSGSQFETALRVLVPELAESEDERIRKAISAAICGTTAETVLEANGVKLVDALAYLEKQKEQKPAEEWNEEDEINKDLAIGKLEGTEVDLDYDVTQQVISWLKWLPNRYVPGGKCTICIEHSRGYQEGLKAGREELKQEWSEEDDDYLMDVKAAVNDYFDEGYAEELCTWLKSLRPQPHWKPSEEQMEALKLIILNGSFTYVNQVQYLISLKDKLKKL